MSLFSGPSGARFTLSRHPAFLSNRTEHLRAKSDLRRIIFSGMATVLTMPRWHGFRCWTKIAFCQICSQEDSVLEPFLVATNTVCSRVGCYRCPLLVLAGLKGSIVTVRPFVTWKKRRVGSFGAFLMKLFISQSANGVASLALSTQVKP